MTTTPPKFKPTPITSVRTMMTSCGAKIETGCTTIHEGNKPGCRMVVAFTRSLQGAVTVELSRSDIRELVRQLEAAEVDAKWLAEHR